MAGSGWLRAGLAMVALGFAVHAMPAARPKARAYGENLLAEYRLPGETIARFASFVPTPPSAALSPRLHMTVADKVAWTGPLQTAGSGRNPYTLVLTVSGVARAAGDVASLWQAGWELRETPSAHREVTAPITAIARTGVAAGTPLKLTAAGTPMSFRDPRDMAAMVGLVSATNFDIQDVRVQVWSGAAPLDWPELALPRSAVLALGLSWLLVVFGLRAWQRRSSVVEARMTPQEPTVGQPAARTDIAPETPVQVVPEAPVERVPETAPLVAAEVVPAEVIAPADAPDHPSRVFAALQQVLTVGLSVRTVLDEKRPPRRRS